VKQSSFSAALLNRYWN